MHKLSKIHESFKLFNKNSKENERRLCKRSCALSDKRELLTAALKSQLKAYKQMEVKNRILFRLHVCNLCALYIIYDKLSTIAHSRHSSSKKYKKFPRI